MTNSLNCVPIAFLYFGGGCILLLTSYRLCVKTTSILESRSGRNMWQACNLFLAKQIPTKCTAIKAFAATMCKINQKDTTINRSEKTQLTVDILKEDRGRQSKSNPVRCEKLRRDAFYYQSPQLCGLRPSFSRERID